VIGDLVATGVAFLTCRENFIEKFLAALAFLSGVIVFLSGLTVIMTWLHFLVPLGSNVTDSSFLLMLSCMILVATSIVASVVLKMDVCRQIPLILRRSFLNTTKSTGTNEFPILTGISSMVPAGSQID
jgi:predicted ferric reductase